MPWLMPKVEPRDYNQGGGLFAVARRQGGLHVRTYPMSPSRFCEVNTTRRTAILRVVTGQLAAPLSFGPCSGPTR